MARTTRGTDTDNRQKIIDTAIALITEKGVEKTSLAEIAAASGLSKGTLYYYFSSKNDLVFDITERHMKRITAEIFAMMDQDTGITMKQLLERLFETLLASDTRSRLHLFLLREAVSGNASLHQRFHHTYTQWFGQVEEVCERLGIRIQDRKATSRILVSMLDGMIIQALLGLDLPPIRTIASQILQIIEPHQPAAP